MDRPRNEIIAPKCSEQELERRTDALLAQGGAVWQLRGASNELSRILEWNFFSEEGYRGAPFDTSESVGGAALSWLMRPCYQSHRPEFSMEEMAPLLLSHYGLNGEVMNGPGMFLLYKQARDAANEPVSAAEMARAMVHKLTGASQLCKPYYARHPFASAIGIPQRQGDEVVETSRQALGRCADEVEAWVAVNQDVIPSFDRQRIGRELAVYRGALAQIDGYLDYVQGYLAHSNQRSNYVHEVDKLDGYIR